MTRYFLHDIGIPVITRLHTPMLLDHYHFSLQKLSKANWQYFWQGCKELKVMKEARYITSCSTSLKEWSLKFLGIQSDKIKVIYNPILSERWSSNSFLHSAAEKDGKKHILFVGTVCDWKGCGDLADACKLLADSGEIGEIQLDLVGKTGAYADELNAKYGKEKWFHLVGKLPREEVMKRYAQADVVCFPSWWENMPMVCIEAMLSGAVVIGSNSGGMSEIIEDGKSGFLLSPRKCQTLAEKIKEVCLLKEPRKNDIRKEANKRIEHVFSLNAILPQIADYYNTVIKDFNK